MGISCSLSEYIWAILFLSFPSSHSLSRASYIPRFEWELARVYTLTVARSSRRYIVKGDYLVRKFSSLAASRIRTRAIVAPRARRSRCVARFTGNERQSAPGRRTGGSGKAPRTRAPRFAPARRGSCSFHAICITAASTLRNSLPHALVCRAR